MESIDFSKQKFRCSSLGNLMTNGPGKKDTRTIDELSSTAIQELIKIFVREMYGRDKEIHSKYIDKGNQVEEDSITLLARVYGQMFKKNDMRKENGIITGEADITDPRLLDTKSCWDIHSFFKHKTEKLSKAYEYQMNGYCELYGFLSGNVCFCLIDTPVALIAKEKDRLFYSSGWITKENPEFLAACEELEKELTFNDIPLKDRLYEVTVKKDPAALEQVYWRAENLWRPWLQEFHEKHASKELQLTPPPQLIEI